MCVCGNMQGGLSAGFYIGGMHVGLADRHTRHLRCTCTCAQQHVD